MGTVRLYASGAGNRDDAKEPNHHAQVPTAAYGVVLLMAAVAYTVLWLVPDRRIERHVKHA